MSVAYNEIGNRNLERIGALSDGLFAIAMTLIVLEIRVPELARPASVARALISLLPSGTDPAIAWIVLVQLNFAISPRVWVVHRI